MTHESLAWHDPARFQTLWDAWGESDMAARDSYERATAATEEGCYVLKLVGDACRAERHECETHVLYRLVCAMTIGLPREIADTRGKIRFYANVSDMLRGRFTVAKHGRFFRRILPHAPDSVIDRLVDGWRAEYGATGATYTLHQGDDESAFIAAYANPTAPARNIMTAGIKHLATSCMRPESKAEGTELGRMFRGPEHPARVYASGDFRVYWLTDAENRTAARVVVRIDTDTPSAAPIYAVDDESAAMLRGVLDSIGADDSDWDGARLRLTRRNGAIVAPYLDCAPRGGREEGDYIVLDSDDMRIECDNTSGYADERDPEPEYWCERCEEGCDDTWTVYDRGYSGPRTESCWCEYCRDHYATECADGEYWDDDCVTRAADGTALSPDDLESGNWQLCELSEEWYAADSLVSVGDMWAHPDNLADNSAYVKDVFGAWQRADDCESCVDGPHAGGMLLRDDCETHDYRPCVDGLRYFDPAQIELELEHA